MLFIDKNASVITRIHISHYDIHNFKGCQFYVGRNMEPILTFVLQIR